MNRTDVRSQPASLSDHHLRVGLQREVKGPGQSLGYDASANSKSRTIGKFVAGGGEVAGCGGVDLETAVTRRQTPQPQSVVSLDRFELQNDAPAGHGRYLGAF